MSLPWIGWFSGMGYATGKKKSTKTVSFAPRTTRSAPLKELSDKSYKIQMTVSHNEKKKKVRKKD